MQDFIAALPLAAVFAAAIALVVCLCVVGYYKKKNRSPSYPLHEFTDLTLTARSDFYIGKHITRVRIQTDKKR